MSRRKPGTYDDGSVDVPLFGPGSDVSIADLGGRQPEGPNGGADERKAKPPTPVAWARCPHCTGSGLPANATQVGPVGQQHPAVALLPSGQHLVWRPHDIVTGSGARTPCRASGVALCQLAPRDGLVTRKARAHEQDVTSGAERVREAARCRCGGVPAGSTAASSTSSENGATRT